ncbi:MAG: hypothetical protein C0406_09860, partial [Sideroxydans sp.]|nr:hypothetical protein [Sideroxydans sp.]
MQQSAEPSVICLHVRAFEQKEWTYLLSRCEHPNLLQTWEYGEAKRAAEGWQPVRGTLMCGDTQVGVVQALVKRIPFLGGIVRINRGPLFICSSGSVTDAVVGGSLKILHRYWVDQEKLPLLIAPEVEKTTQNMEMFAQFGYQPVLGNGWSSAIIDLTADEDTLHRQLQQKWRNQLHQAQRMGLTLDVSASEGALNLLLNEYRKLMRMKQFSGPSERLIRELARQLQARQRMQILFACKDNHPVAGILVVGVVGSCTYLVGWNSEEGRKLQAGNFLLWEAMLHFKRIGFHWFDVGGLSEERTPSITKFKRGLGGSEYQLVG